MKKIILATSYPLIDSNAAKERVLLLSNIKVIKKKRLILQFFVQEIKIQENQKKIKLYLNT